MKIIARIPAVAADEARLTVRVPMPESALDPVPEPQPEFAEPGLMAELPRESAEPSPEPQARSNSRSEPEPTSKSKSKTGPKSKSKSKSKAVTWTYASPKSLRIKVAGFPALSSVVLVLLAAAVWCLAAWNDMERIERHRRAERLAQMPADGSLSEWILR